MEEQASFETRAVLAPRRARLSRLALLLPAVALMVIVVAGLNGAPAGRTTAQGPDPSAAAATVAVPRPRPPDRVLGLQVRRLDEIDLAAVGRDDVLVVSGWFVPTAVNDCPPIAAIYRDGALPNVRGDADELVFCVRSGVLHATSPDDDGRLPHAGLSSIPASLVVGVIAPRELEIVGSGATEVVVLGRLVPTGDGCGTSAGCGRELVIDHVAWTGS